jgi:hypothetical protein
MTPKLATTRVPNIQTPVETVNANVIHYGYCAYNDISLLGSTGIEYDVQPGNSPFRTMLPAKELIPFVTMEVGEIDHNAVEKIGNADEGGNIVVRRNKSARECITEISRAYQKFGFRYLEPLTGVNEEDAFHIFQTIQPFLYKIKDLSYELTDPAINRIAQTSTYTVKYQGASIQIEPLPEHLKGIANKTRAIMSAAGEQAYRDADYIISDTQQKMTMFFSTGLGKRNADPRDRYIFDQMEQEVPQFLATPDRTTPASNEGYLKVIADALTGVKANPQPNVDTARIAQLEAQVAALLELNKGNAKCSEVSKTTGEPCKNDATENGKCGVHNK